MQLYFNHRFCKNVGDLKECIPLLCICRKFLKFWSCLCQVRWYVNDVARIYSITVTNALDGVSSSCRACALSTQPSGSACVPCPLGHYIDTLSSKCVECPPNTYLVPHATTGPDACTPCGPASKSDKVCCRGKQGSRASYFKVLCRKHKSFCAFQDHRKCYSDCHFTHTDGNVTLTFDFRSLGSAMSLMNSPKFTTKGTKYFHVFNISLCGEQVGVHKQKRQHVEKVAVFNIWRYALLECPYRLVSSAFLRVRLQCARTTLQTCPSPVLGERKAKGPAPSGASSVSQP